MDEVLRGFSVVYGNPEYPGLGFDPNPWGEEVVADPVEVASPDGRWRFSTIPFARDFRGPSRGKLECEGRLVWERNLPLTFEGSTVSDDGYVVGYGVPSDFQIWSFDPDGFSRLVQRIPTTMGRGLHASDNPVAKGAFIHPELGLFAVRIVDPEQEAHGEDWLAYRLEDGRPLRRIQPRRLAREGAGLISLTAVHPLPDTPLTLVQWYRYKRTVGTRFALLNETGHEVWRLQLPRDFEEGGGLPEELVNQLRWEGTVLSVGPGARFEIGKVEERKRVSFEVEQREISRGSGRTEWFVKEVDQSPFEVAEEALREADDEGTVEPAKRVELASLGSFRLGEEPSQPAVRTVVSFEVTESGEIEFVRGDRHSFESLELVLLDREGAVCREVPIRGLPDEVDGSRFWCRLDSDRWLFLAGTGFREDGTASAWTVDSKSGAAVSMGPLDSPGCEAVVADGRGGFVVASNYLARSMGKTTLRRFDGDGSLLWQHSGSELAGVVRMSQDVALTSTGEVVVLDKGLHFFDLTGRYARSVSLDDAMGRPGSYTTQLTACADENLIVLDFGDERRLWRTAFDGGEPSSFVARYADGRTNRYLAENLHVGPDGEVWTSDGHVLLRLDEEGLETHRFGRASSSEELVAPAGVLVGPTGDIYVSDSASCTIHRFEPDGTPSLVFHPDPTDFRECHFNQMTVDGDGSLHVQSDRNDLDGLYVRFHASGERSGPVRIGKGETVFVPGSRRRWTLVDLERLLLFDEEGSQKAAIDRLPDGQWFGSVSDFVVGSDGSVAVLATKGFTATLALYARDGTARFARALPTGEFFYFLEMAGDWIVARNRDDVFLVRVESQAAYRFRPFPEGDGRDFALGLNSDGTELLVFDFEARSVERLDLQGL